MDMFKTSLLIFPLICYCLGIDYRLPDTVLPTHYDLSLTLNLENSTFSGIANISLKTSDNTTKDIYLHSDSDYVQLSSTAILNNNAKCYIGTPSDGHILAISCSRALIKDGDNSLYMEFTGRFSEKDGYGLVKSKYLDNGKEQILIESNFKPTYARRAFPCLDEPKFQAAFTLQLKYSSGYTAISNSPIIESYLDTREDLQTTKFETTPEISTYLVTVLLSKFQEVNATSEDNVDFKIFTRSGIAGVSADVANNYYDKIIQTLDEYTGIPYQNLSDVESYFVALPDYSDTVGDFGVFTYREADLLDEGEKTSSKVKQNIIANMVYKLSHEWYGGDVGTTWWSDVWANEAVATYLKYILANEVDSELELKNQFVVEMIQRSLQVDAYPSARPLTSEQSEVNSDWEIERKLTTNDYEKGASILHMISVILKGAENFQISLQNHWQNRKDGATDGADLLVDLLANAFDDENTNYYDFLKQWMSSPGYPLITASIKELNVTDIVSITQKRFMYPTSDSIEQDVWNIPLTSSSSYVDVVLHPDDDMMYFIGGGTNLIFNYLGACYYRVNYDEILWGRILDTLRDNMSTIHVLQRSKMIDDVFNIARTGDVNYSLAFEMADVLVDETEYYPWFSAFNAFSYLLGKMVNQEVEWNVKNYILKLMENIIVIPTDAFVEEEDKHIDILKKVMILDWACKLGHEGCIAYATGKFNDYKESAASLTDNNIREIIFCNGIRHSENVNEDWNFLWNVYTSSSSVHEQNDILNALGCADDKDVLQSYLLKTITANSGIKRQDILVAFKSVLSSSSGLESAMEFLEIHLPDIQNFYQDTRMLSEIVYAVAEKLLTDDQLNWLDNLLSDEILSEYDDVKSKASTLATVNNYWQKNFQKDVTDIFPAASSSTKASTQWTPTTIEPPTTTDSGSGLTLSRFLFVVLIGTTICIEFY